MMKFRMLPIRLPDIADIIRIAEECELSSWSADDYIDELKRNESIMLRLETDTRETVGFLVGRRVISSKMENAYDSEIYNIGVKHRFRRNGCGTILLTSFLENCQKNIIRTVWLDARRSNENAIRFYEKNGFKIYTVRKNFYNDPPEDAMVMNLDL